MVKLHLFNYMFTHTTPSGEETVQKERFQLLCPFFTAPLRKIPTHSQPMHALPFSPMSKLPVELLSCIFMLSCEPDNNQSMPFDSSTVKTPLILSRVCRHWRDVARNTPRLWTRISISPELLVENAASDPLACVDTTHITTCLALSRKCPLEILIDARDEDWDFSEPEIMPVDLDSTYDPFFAPALIGNSLSLLIPHLGRWQTLIILTDTWAPMFVALNVINPYLTSFGAPLLETLTLMRCNDFVSFSPEFRPRHLAKPYFMGRRKRSEPSSEMEEDSAVKVPRLKHLTLKGVHVDWEALANTVEDSQVGGLKTLCLSSHSSQVRPSRNEFRRLLNASAALEDLSISGSGPFPPSGSLANDDIQRVRLDKLERLEVGYRSLGEAKAIFGSILAPSVKEMVLEDVSHPADVDDVDGRGVLACLMEEKAGKRTVPLGDVEELTLRNVKFGKIPTAPEALRRVIAGVTRLKELKVEDMGVENVLLTLVPSGTSCPCPELEFLTMKVGPICTAALDYANASTEVYLQMAKRLIEERRAILPQTSVGLQEVKIGFELPRGANRGPEKAEALVGGALIDVEMRGKFSGPEDEGEEEDKVDLGPFNDAFWGPIFGSETGSGLERLGDL